MHHLKGFKWDPAWKPIDKKGNRAGFVHVPALVSTQSGASFEFDFNAPWAVILDDGLENGPHHVRIRIAEDHHPDSNGTALRVFHLLLNQALC